MKRPLTIGYITVDDPRDRRTWSGINSFLLDALEREVEHVVLLGPLKPQPVLFLCRAFNQITLRLFRKRFNYRDSFPLAKAYARILRRRIAQQGIDLLIAPAGLATTALLKTKVPIVYFNDRSIAGALDYHKVLRDLLIFSREQGLALEKATIENASLVVYASQWAADAATAAVPSAAQKVKVVPMGANLLKFPPPPTSRDFPPAKLKLLFLGVYWEDKGGPIAYDALLELKRRGHAAQLVVCGCEPPASCNDVDLVREGFLNKNVPEKMERLVHHLSTADVLVLPTRFEAYGIVFCEAAAYGLPVLATRTGGVPTIVQEGITGNLFAMEQGGAAYADAIEAMINDPARWQAMRSNARKRFEQVLNWDAFMKRLFAHIEEAGLIKSAR
ncbi:MAG: glycosyltransferase family 4 protein [Flavobacteriales bacterium]